MASQGVEDVAPVESACLVCTKPRTGAIVMHNQDVEAHARRSVT